MRSLLSVGLMLVLSATLAGCGADPAAPPDDAVAALGKAQVCTQSIDMAAVTASLEDAADINAKLAVMAQSDSQIKGIQKTSSQTTADNGVLVYNLVFFVDGEAYCNYDIDISFAVGLSCVAEHLRYDVQSYTVNSVSGGGAFCPSPGEIQQTKLPKILQTLVGETYVSTTACAVAQLEENSLCLAITETSATDASDDGPDEAPGEAIDTDPLIPPETADAENTAAVAAAQAAVLQIITEYLLDDTDDTLACFPSGTQQKCFPTCQWSAECPAPYFACLGGNDGYGPTTLGYGVCVTVAEAEQFFEAIFGGLSW